MNRPIPTMDDLPSRPGIPDPLHGWGPYSDFHKERIRAHEKHRASGGSMEQKEWDDPACLRIVLEELGEIARAFNDYDLGQIPNEAELLAQVHKELIQLGAMVSAWTDATVHYAPRAT